MKHLILILLGIGLCASIATSQTQQPFTFTAYGGLFFPSYDRFNEIYHSNSDLIWGVGAALPLSGPLYLTGDVAFFHSDGIVDPTIDSTSRLEERFIHVGVLDKQPLAATLWLRLMAGINYVGVKQTAASARSAEQSYEAEKKIGYYGGIGVEQMADPAGHLSFFLDVLYDYRRSRQKDLVGDFGGVRVILGMNLILF